MKRKTIICVAAIVILIAATAALIVFNNRPKQDEGGAQAVSSPDEAVEIAAFPMEYPDRLCGIPAAGFEANDNMIEVRYGTGGFVRKALGAADNSDKTEYNESCEQIVNGLTVSLKGNDGLWYLAVWNDNNFTYTVSAASGVDVNEMTDYIEATR